MGMACILFALSTITASLARERNRERQDTGGKGAELFSTFYDQLKDIKGTLVLQLFSLSFFHSPSSHSYSSSTHSRAEFHRKSPHLEIERPEAEQILNNLSGVENLFTGEEGYGRYLDLHPHFQTFVNLKGIDRVDYIEYLERFSSFPDRASGMMRMAFSGFNYVSLHFFFLDFRFSFIASCLFYYFPPMSCHSRASEEQGVRRVRGGAVPVPRPLRQAHAADVRRHRQDCRV
jgi:hypothetical protein